MAKRSMLQGIRVVDLTTVVFGPYCTKILAELGADVVKVETPGVGDTFRYAGKPAATTGMGPPWLAFNRGKRSAALDLKNDADRAVMMDLLKEADVFVVNVRGKALSRLGLDHASLQKINPRLIYVHCVGFGQDGPYADLQAYDDVIQAASGTATLLGRVDGDDRPRYLPSLIADKVAGLHAAYATLAALFHRERTGEGQKIDVPMFEAFSSFMLAEHLGGLTFDPPNAKAGYARQLDPDRQPFPTADGHISIVAYSDDAWLRLFDLLGQSAFLERDDLSTPHGRAQNHRTLYQAIARATPAFTTQELLAHCHAAQIPAQQVRDLDDILDDPHLSATGFFQKRVHPTEGVLLESRASVRFGVVMPDEAPPAPLLGQHSAQIRSDGWGQSNGGGAP